MDAKPFAPACERNRDPILAVLRTQFADRRNVLEVGSGTGQHAVYFAAAMPWLSWQCADLPTQLPGIRQWLDEAGLPNTPPPLALDVGGPWPTGPYDAVFSANILHIVGWPGVEAFFAGVGRVLGADGMLVVYGPVQRGRHLHEREQSRLRCLAESARSALRDPRCRSGAGPRRAGRAARRRRRGDAGEQPLPCLAGLTLARHDGSEYVRADSARRSPTPPHIARRRVSSNRQIHPREPKPRLPGASAIPPIDSIHWVAFGGKRRPR